MFERIKALIHRWDEIHEVDALTERDLDDLGMTRAQLEDFVRMPRDVDTRVRAMAAIYGVDEKTLREDHGQWVEMLHTCGQCRERGHCSKVLERGDLARPADAPFCLNADDFRSLSTPKQAAA